MEFEEPFLLFLHDRHRSRLSLFCCSVICGEGLRLQACLLETVPAALFAAAGLVFMRKPSLILQ